LLSAWPRQPFLGLAISASIGILLADFAAHYSTALAAALATIAVIALLTRNSVVVYLFVAAAFFMLHSFRTIDSPGLQLARELGEEPRPVTIRGVVISEPKFSERGSASFLFQADSIEIDGETRSSRAKLFARWRHVVEFGDEIQLFAIPVSSTCAPTSRGRMCIAK